MAASIWGAEQIIRWINTSPVFDNRWLADLAQLRGGTEQANTPLTRSAPASLSDSYSAQANLLPTPSLYNRQGQTAPSQSTGNNSRSTPSPSEPSEPNRPDQAVTGSSAAPTGAQEQLSESELALVRELAQIDRNIRAHEAAHLSAAAGLAVSGMNFGYTRGPDGIRYATSGEVSIDTSEVPNDPEATYSKALQIQTAALAPRDPSPQDRAVASMARQMAMEAQIEITRLRTQTPAQDAIQGYLATLTQPTTAGTNLYA